MGIGFRNAKKVVGRTPGFYPYTKQDIKHAGWCIEKNIKIAVIPNWDGASNEWKVELNIKKKIHLDPAIYKADEAYKKMYEYAKYYYDKYRN